MEVFFQPMEKKTRFIYSERVKEPHKITLLEIKTFFSRPA